MLKNRFAIVLGLTIVLVSFFSLSNVFATDINTAQDNLAISVPVSCTMNGTGMTSHTANIPNGTYESGIGTTTLKSFCNDNQGFAIYAVGYSNDTIGNTTLIGANLGQTIVTGTATTTGNPDVSNWAVKLETSSGATYPLTLDNGFGSYSNVPSTYTKVAHRDSGTDLGSSATGATLTTTYAAYISKTEKADTYNGRVKYTLVHPSNEIPLQSITCDPGKICYNPNTALVEGEMGKQSVSNNTSVTLYAPNFKRTGYGFAGWSDVYDYDTNANAHFYGPNQDITTPADIETNGLSLYAVWVPSAGTLQNWNGCSGMSVGDVTALTDNRDNDTYAVAKLADGKCWMIENLRLADKDAEGNYINLSSANTHNPSLPLTNIYDSSTTSNHLSPTSSVTYNATTAPEGWCSSASSACSDQSRLRTDNTVLFTNNTSSSYDAEGDVYSYGNYYNWYSATAGHGKFDSSTAPGDICPVGWHLPIGKNNGEYYNLNYAINDNNNTTDSTASQKIRSYPSNFVYSGSIAWGVYGILIYDRNSYGDYWSASGYNADNANGLSIYSTYVYPGTGSGNMYRGEMVRCIAGV